MFACCVTPFGVVPIACVFQQVIEVLVTYDAEGIEHFVFDRLNHSLDVSLQVRGSHWRFLDFAVGGSKHGVKWMRDLFAHKSKRWAAEGILTSGHIRIMTIVSVSHQERS